jgi:DNA-binding PadR family transcriptional regulator
MERQRRLSEAALDVLAIFIQAPETPRYGLELIEAADLAGGTLYPILARLEKRGWLEGEWEADVEQARAARRYYRLTEEGADRGRRELASARQRARTRLSRLTDPSTHPEGAR